MRKHVIVSNGHNVYYGQMWWEHPVDVPPLIEANGKRWTYKTWVRHGYTIEDDEAP